jgi:hypothetical protein
MSRGEIDAIFVVGTGRSGTHFTCHCLREFAHLEDFLHGREHGRTLYRLAFAAMRGKSFPLSSRWHYEVLRLRSLLSGKVLIDQHHPNLFHIGALARLFPKAVFLYPNRPAVQVVASMITHEGVSGWYRKILSNELQVPFPNRFFGLESCKQLVDEPLHRICYYRVRAHHDAALEARRRFGERVRFIDYQRLVEDRRSAFQDVFTVDELARFGRATTTVKSEVAALSKYKERLTMEQIDDILELEDAGWNSIGTSGPVEP